MPTLNIASTRGKRSSPVAIIVQAGNRAGRLMTDRVAEQGSQYNGMNIEEIVLSEIKLLEIMMIE